MGPSRSWVRGGVAGLLGATVLALWFLIVDSTQGDPFRVPALLASGLFSIEGLEASAGLILGYTIIHYAAFVAVGIGVNSLFDRVDWAPSTLLGLALGFALFDLVFFLSVTITGIDIVQELGWLEVLSGNVLAGFTVMGYLHVTSASRPVTWWEALADHAVVREGAVAGLIGAATVAAWFLLFDIVQGRPLFTPAALGSALFLGASSLGDVQLSAGTVGGYSLLHIGAFVILGVVGSVIAREAEVRPPMLLGAVFLFVFFGAVSLALFAIVAEFLLGPASIWSIGGANLLAVLAMGYFLWQKHPEVQLALAEQPLDKAS